jgi:beta-N-acetylhexosaminidase
MVFKKAPAVLLFFIFVSALLCPLEFDDPGDPALLASRLTDSMSDEQALAQCFMLGWVGAEPSPLILNWIRDRNIGGVKIFGWNTGDTKRLAATVGGLQKAALESGFGIPLFVATDQEGGMVRHVKGSTSETPGNMAIGASGRPVDAYWSGYYIGAELSLLGVNMNFAPTVDLYTNRESVLIGSRSFGNDPVQAGILGAAFVKGLAANGVIATAKHFPGHGDTSLDSHGVLPRIDATFETIWDRELVPYRFLAREGLTAIMTGHLAFPNTEAGEAPASLSSWFLKDILREKIGYKGLIITDDLMMNGATAFAGSLSRAAKQALLAGNDVILFSKTPSLYDPVWTFLLESMTGDAVFRERVRDAARRILEVKLEYLRGEHTTPYIPDLKKVEEGLSSPESSAFFLDLAARSVTIVKDSGVLPLDREKAGRVLLAGQYQDFFSVGKKAYPDAVSYWYSSQASPEFLYYARNSDTIIFCLSGEDGLKPLSSLKELGKRVIVFSVLSPIYLEDALWADAAIAVYSYSPDSFVAGFSAMLGRIKAEGKIPFLGRPAPPELPPGTGQ